MVGIAPLPSSISNACLLVNANLDKASGEPTGSLRRRSVK
jgi:hypothetical protein